MGEVTIYQPSPHGKGWQVAVRSGSTQKNYSRRTEKEALELIIDLVAEERARTPVAMTDAIKAYQDDLRARGRRESTITEAGHRLRPLERLVDNVQQLRRAHIEKRLRGEGRRDGRPHKELSAATRRGTLARLRDACAYWRRRGWMMADPTKGLLVEETPDRGKETLTPREALLLHQVLLDDSSAAATAVLLVLRTGMRTGEIRGLRVRDLELDSDRPTATVRHGKTRQSARALLLEQPLPARLAALTDKRALADFVFVDADGVARGKKWLLYHTKRLCALAGVTVITGHGLRGTFKRLADNEADAAVGSVTRALGHSGPEVGRRHYAPGSEEEREAVTVSKLFGAKGEK